VNGIELKFFCVTPNPDANVYFGLHRIISSKVVRETNYDAVTEWQQPAHTDQMKDHLHPKFLLLKLRYLFDNFSFKAADIL